ncbi:MAG: hypothetical protein O2819_01610 [Planctomycetota bacterium]|nr:hypothetical protein [Planctomycetota bacterium]
MLWRAAWARQRRRTATDGMATNMDRASCWIDPVWRSGLTRVVALVVVVVCGGDWVRGAAAQIPWPAVTGTFGDLNDDRRVNNRDLDVISADFASGVYQARSDLNRDGVVNQRDVTDLQRAVDFSNADNLRIPQFYFSELRWGRPNFGGLDQARFIEFGITTQPVTTQFTGVFPAGVFYLAIAKQGSGQLAEQGVIVAVEDLSGKVFGTIGSGANKCLLLDPDYQNTTFPLPLPPEAETPRNYAQRNLGDPVSTVPSISAFYEDLNVVHLLVYRRPSAGAYSSPVARPDIGQDVDEVPSPGCQIDNRSGTVGDQVPPWDFILDGVTLLRSSNSSQNATYGCPYAKGSFFSVPPDGQAATYHAWRCEPFGTWRSFSPLAYGADTPGAKNAECQPEAYCGSVGAGDCFSSSIGPYCNDAECCNYVCNVDSACCSVRWDSSCAELAQAQCTSCGGLGTGGCLDPHDNPYCDDPACCSAICAIYPLCCILDWDASCAEQAQEECLSCGDALAGPCSLVHAYPNCSDAVCCETVCSADPTCCTASWDQPCVDYAADYCNASQCGSPSAGSCCLSKATPGCNDETVCGIVCTKDPYCCTVRWDIFCAQLADDYVLGGCACGPIGDPPSPYFGCFDTNAGPGCDDWACCDTVCNADGFCCGVEWDSACVAVAQSLCSEHFADTCGLQLDNDPLAMSCLVPHVTPGCDDGGCCDTVCSLDPLCCDPANGWDASCVKLAQSECESCGEALTESCYVAHGSPSCNLGSCCEAVCAADPFCCEFEWDFTCAALAVDSLCPEPIEQCGADGLRPCETWSTLPGCSDDDCCTMICTQYDPFCCEARWDAICVQEAITFCRPPLGSGRGDCLQVHDEPGCADANCTATVCSVDPACCEDLLFWDQSCVNAASVLCLVTGSCPSQGSPFSPRNEPGCDDIACCNVVCGVDPTCCNESWDASCVQTALVYCKPFPQWECPCFGSPFEIHDNPGSNDESCCSVVCQVDPGCCIDSWDEGCVSKARDLCCGPIGCGSGCNEDCFTDHESPYCNDPYCCEAVCQSDPYCCSSGWDGFCADLAAERCTGCGSDSTETGCFVARSSRGCSIPECCKVVCEQDIFCCQTAWDSTCVDLALADSDCADERPECGDDGLGDPCVVHLDVGCSDEDCCDAVCGKDMFCCEVSWDATCVSLALASDDCPCAKEPGDPCAGPCCESHAGPSCDNEECADAVCASDSYCCEVEWDQFCASAARTLCYEDNGGACPFTCGVPGTGNCCIAHIDPACDDASCCEEVCAKDPYCCVQSWDQTCVDQAARNCGDLCATQGLYCGSPSAGDCASVHGTPYCNDKGCCSLVCGIFLECCTISWDETCVAIAQKVCP